MAKLGPGISLFSPVIFPKHRTQEMGDYSTNIAVHVVLTFHNLFVTIVLLLFFL